MSKTDTLLMQSFGMQTKDKKWTRCGSAVDTCSGTAAQWSFLERMGFVVKNTRSGRGCLGHDFSRAITDEGRAHLDALCKEANGE